MVVALWLTAVNCAAVLAFRQDKARARAGTRRVPEATLLWLAAWGGTPGTFTARHLFRHRTRKQPFSDRLWLIAVVQVGGLIGTLLV